MCNYANLSSANHFLLIQRRTVFSEDNVSSVSLKNNSPAQVEKWEVQTILLKPICNLVVLGGCSAVAKIFRMLFVALLFSCLCILTCFWDIGMWLLGYF